MDMISFSEIAFVPLIIGVSEALKMVGFNQKFIPVVNIVLGLALSISLNLEQTLVKDIVCGIALGLSASGLYSGTKNVYQELKSN